MVPFKYKAAVPEMLTGLPAAFVLRCSVALAVAVSSWLLGLRRRVHVEDALREAPLAIDADQLVLDSAAGQKHWWGAALVQQPVCCGLCRAQAICFDQHIAGQVAVAGCHGLAAVKVFQDGANTLDSTLGGDDLQQFSTAAQGACTGTGMSVC